MNQIIQRLLVAVFALGLLGASSGCIIRAEGRGHSHARVRSGHGSHQHCHYRGGKHHKQKCHSHPHNGGHH